MANGVLPQACAASFSCRSSDATDACAPPAKIVQGETIEPNQTCLSEKWIPQNSHWFCHYMFPISFAVGFLP